MKTSKVKLQRFIEKYHLGGNVNSVVLNSEGPTLSTRFITGDKSLLGELSMNSWQFEDISLGVYDTEQFSKLLNVLGDEINIDLTKSGDKAISLEMSDTFSKVNFMLSDLSVINTPPALKKMPEFQLKVKVDKKFITTFISGKSALPDTDSFTVISDDAGTRLVIGYAAINTNRITLPVQTESNQTIDNVSFNANMFSDVLTANKECESAILEVSNEGLARINFKVDEYNVTYYLVALQAV